MVVRFFFSSSTSSSGAYLEKPEDWIFFPELECSQADVTEEKLHNGGKHIGKNVMEMINPALSVDGEGNKDWRKVIHATK